MSTNTPALDAAAERRYEETYERRSRRLDRLELLFAVGLSAGFLVLAVALAWFATPAREFSPLIALAFVAAYAFAARIEFSSGTGFAVPTQLLFVPMLLLLPTPLVPLLVALANFGSAVYDARRDDLTPGRVLFSPVDAIFALAPAVVLVAADAQTPALEHLPIYVLALAAQFASEFVVYAVRGRVFHGMRFREVAVEMWMGHRVDVLLAPIGLLAALAAAGTPAAALLALALIPLLRGFERERESRIQHGLELSRAYRGTALLLRDLLEEDDEYTGHHTEDVVELAVKVADEMGLDEDTRRETEMGALLHDIGKIAVPDEIINKPGPLDDDEWAVMKTHTVVGERMLQQVGGLLTSVGRVVRASHERWDGGGYPDGLAGAEIPMAARICAACDAFNAMTTDRSYRKALPFEVAVGELRANAGTQFAPDVVDALIAVVARETPDWQLALTSPDAGQAVGGKSITVSSAP
ncbi:MAG TPA: HD-GYP domain-containing protein [Solirubrobacteraceae bacterium]|nr:HD-GYP domain-containing protein [Solirubrobacteraceae bacterium]